MTEPATGHNIRQVPPWPPHSEATYMLTRWECSCGWEGRATADTRDNREQLMALAEEAALHQYPPVPDAARVAELERRLELALSVVNMELGNHPIAQRLRPLLRTGVSPEPPIAQAIEELVAAWQVPGPRLNYHHQQLGRLLVEWPTLHRAIERLVAATRREG